MIMVDQSVSTTPGLDVPTTSSEARATHHSFQVNEFVWAKFLGVWCVAQIVAIYKNGNYGLVWGEDVEKRTKRIISKPPGDLRPIDEINLGNSLKHATELKWSAAKIDSIYAGYKAMLAKTRQPNETNPTLSLQAQKNLRCMMHKMNLIVQDLCELPLI